MQYTIEIGSNCNFQHSQGSVETYLSWGGESLWYMCTKFPQESDSERILYQSTIAEVMIESVLFIDSVYILMWSFKTIQDKSVMER